MKRLKTCILYLSLIVALYVINRSVVVYRHWHTLAVPHFDRKLIVRSPALDNYHAVVWDYGRRMYLNTAYDIGPGSREVRRLASIQPIGRVNICSDVGYAVMQVTAPDRSHLYDLRSGAELPSVNVPGIPYELDIPGDGYIERYCQDQSKWYVKLPTDKDFHPLTGYQKLQPYTDALEPILRLDSSRVLFSACEDGSYRHLFIVLDCHTDSIATYGPYTGFRGISIDPKSKSVYLLNSSVTHITRLQWDGSKMVTRGERSVPRDVSGDMSLCLFRQTTEGWIPFSVACYSFSKGRPVEVLCAYNWESGLIMEPRSLPEEHSIGVFFGWYRDR